MILAYDANLGRMEFSERTRQIEEVVGADKNVKSECIIRVCMYFACRASRNLQAIEDLIGPEAL